jgi:hypothetical protein
MMNQHETKLKLLGMAVEMAKAVLPAVPAGPAEPTLGQEALNRNLQAWETVKIFYNGFAAAMSTDATKDGFALPAVPADPAPAQPAVPTGTPAGTTAAPTSPAGAVAAAVAPVAAAAGSVLQSLIKS